MPRKTRRQYRKKNKRGGADAEKRVTGKMSETMSETMKKTGENLSKMSEDTKNARQNVTRKARGLFSNWKWPWGKNSNDREPSPPTASTASPPTASPPTASTASAAARPAASSQGPVQGKGGKRKSRRFIKKKGKVTLQGGRRIRSRKSKTRCRTRRRR